MTLMQAPSRPVRVAVANDFDLVVAGVAALLAQFSPGLEVIELVVGQEAVDEPVDIVLFDTYGRAETDLDRVSDLRRKPNVGRVAVYTLSWNAEMVQAALGHGADAVLSKTLPASRLAADLTRVASGESIVDPGSGRAVRSTGRLWPGGDCDLTERESEVLSLVGAGLSNVEVGRHLHLGLNTVKTHLRHAYRKVGVKNRAQAASYVLQHRT